jgi:uncharacterized protein (UPF0548 family)
MARLAAEYATAMFSYDEVGATKTGHVPNGYEGIELSCPVGRGTECFERAGDDLLTWVMHRAARTHPISSAGTAEPGSHVLLQLRLLGLAVLAPCRVVWAMTDGDERGFAYGTLPDHPEIGEEAFLVSLAGDGTVTFRVYGFSRPAPGLPERFRPMTRRIQARAIKRYARALGCD